MFVVTWRALYREGLLACPCTVTEEKQGNKERDLGDLWALKTVLCLLRHFDKIGTEEI